MVSKKVTSRNGPKMAWVVVLANVFHKKSTNNKTSFLFKQLPSSLMTNGYMKHMIILVSSKWCQNALRLEIEFKEVLCWAPWPCSIVTCKTTLSLCMATGFSAVLLDYFWFQCLEARPKTRKVTERLNIETVTSQIKLKGCHSLVLHTLVTVCMFLRLLFRPLHNIWS